MLVTSPCLNLSRGPVGHVTRGSTNLAVRLVPRGCDGDGDHDLDLDLDRDRDLDRDLDRTRAGGQGAWDSRYRHVFPREYPEGATRTWWWVDVWAAASCGGPPSCGRWSISLSVSPSPSVSPPPIQTSGARASSPTTLFHRYVIVDASPLANACRTSRNKAQSALTKPWHTAASVVQTAGSRLPAAVHWKTCIAKGDVTGNESFWCPGRSEHHPSFVVR